MLDFNDPFIQIITILVLVAIFAIILLSLNRQKNKKLQYLTEELEQKNQYAENLQKELQQSKEKLFTQGGTTKSSSFIHEQIIKIEDLEDEIQLYKQRLNETKIIAQEANMVKQEFLANIRHEVRTPLNSILTFADMLRSQVKDTTQLSYVNNIYTSGHNLLAFMDKIIELSHLKSDSFKLEEKAVDIGLLFESILNTYRKKAEKKGLKLSLHIDENMPQSLILDDKKVQTILNNILDNAIKFTKNGSVKIDVKVDSTNIVNNTMSLAISVEDTGIGIDLAHKKKLFDVFEKKENANELEFQGTGLGLSINRKMARHMGGDIVVKSKISKGSVFTLLLKDVEIVLQNADIEKNEKLDFTVLNAAKIIVVDEAEENRVVFAESFTKTKIDANYFNNPRSAIEFLKNNTVELIFMDVDLLEMDDGAASKVMARLSKAPVVTLTTRSLKDISFAPNGLKVIGHLKKPIAKLALFKLCIKTLNSSHLLKKQTLQIEKEKAFDNVQQAHIKDFLSEVRTEVDSLHKKAQTTNDLHQSEKFAKSLKTLAKKYKIEYFVTYGDELLKKIELFDIDAIEKLMDNYNELINILKKKAK